MQQANSKEEKHRSDLARSQRYDRDIMCEDLLVTVVFAVGLAFALACVVVQRPGHGIYEECTVFPYSLFPSEHDLDTLFSVMQFPEDVVCVIWSSFNELAFLSCPSHAALFTIEMCTTACSMQKRS